MLDIISSKSYAPYTCSPRPVIQVTHQLQPEQLRDLLQIAVETLGKDEVNAILGNRTGQYSQQFKVFVAGGSAPRVVHDTYDQAKAEAERLSKKTGRIAYVFKVMAEVSVQMPEPKTIVREFK